MEWLLALLGNAAVGGLRGWHEAKEKADAAKRLERNTTRERAGQQEYAFATKQAPTTEIQYAGPDNALASALGGVAGGLTGGVDLAKGIKELKSLWAKNPDEISKLVADASDSFDSNESTSLDNRLGDWRQGGNQFASAWTHPGLPRIARSRYTI